MPGTTSSRSASSARFRERRLGVADVLLALATELVDQGLAVALEAGVDKGRDTGRLRRLGDGGIELALRGQAEGNRVLRGDVRHVPVRRSRIAAMVVRVVPMSLPIWPSVTSGWFLMIQAIPSGLSWRLETGV